MLTPDMVELWSEDYVQNRYQDCIAISSTKRFQQRSFSRSTSSSVKLAILLGAPWDVSSTNSQASKPSIFAIYSCSSSCHLFQRRPAISATIQKESAVFLPPSKSLSLVCQEECSSINDGKCSYYILELMCSEIRQVQFNTLRILLFGIEQ